MLQKTHCPGDVTDENLRVNVVVSYSSMMRMWQVTCDFDDPLLQENSVHVLYITVMKNPQKYTLTKETCHKINDKHALNDTKIQMNLISIKAINNYTNTQI